MSVSKSARRASQQADKHTYCSSKPSNYRDLIQTPRVLFILGRTSTLATYLPTWVPNTSPSSSARNYAPTRTLFPDDLANCTALHCMTHVEFTKARICTPRLLLALLVIAFLCVYRLLCHACAPPGRQDGSTAIRFERPGCGNPIVRRLFADDGCAFLSCGLADGAFIPVPYRSSRPVGWE